MKVNAVAVCLAMVIGSVVVETVDDGVHVVDGGSFEKFLSEGSEALVFIHGKECPFCDSVKGVFRQLAGEVGKEYPGLRFAVAEGESDEALKASLDVVSTPQLRLYFNSGFFSFFDDEFVVPNLVSFLDFHLHTTARPTHVDSDRSYVRFSNRANAILLSFPEVGSGEADFALGLQRVVPDVPVYYVRSDSKYAHMSFPPDSSQSTHKMKMKRDFDEGDKYLGTRERFLPKHILQIVWPYRKSRVEVFSARTVKDVFSLKKPAVVLFDEEYEGDKAEVFRKAVLAKTFDGLAVKCRLDEEGADRLRVLFGVRRADFPAVRAVHWVEGKPVKYALEGPLDKASLEAFLEGFEARNLTSYRKSQRVDDQPGAVVRTLNRELFSSQLSDSSTHFVYALVGKDRTVHETLLHKTHPLLKRPQSFVFGILDVNLNELDSLDRKKVPVLHVLTRKQRHRPLTYEGPMEPASFAEYLNESIDGNDEL